jgi:hypothetical protein
MSIDNLFPDHPPPKKHVTLQQRLLDYMRKNRIITEEVYRSEIGGKSVSAALHNIKRRGLLEPGEYILPDKMVGAHGASAPAYRLVKESSTLDIPQKEPELDVNRVGKEPDIGDFAEEPEIGASDFAEYIGEDEEPPVLKNTPPEVSSIVVGVSGHQPELIIMFMGDEYKPLRHVMNLTEVKYLITNLMAFIPQPKE